MSKLLKERRESKDKYEDMLSCLMRGNNDNRCKLNDEELIDLIITIMYSGYETISTTSMMAVKYLHDHPKVLEEMRVCAKVLITIAFSLSFFFYDYMKSCRKNTLLLEKGKSQKIPSIVMISSQ